MFIRSQDRKKLINASALHVLSSSEGFEIISRLYSLGMYSTEEKAMKVMDMIETAILENEIANSVIDIGYLEKSLFQMPKDDEVEV